MFQSSTKIYLSKSKIPHAGRGVFASCDLTPNEIIEICPVVEIPENQLGWLRKTELFNYFFKWGRDLKKGAICLGFGSLYNHSYTPNATYIKNFKQKQIEFVTIKEIKKGEEITVNYNLGDPNDQRPLWIKAISKLGG